MFRFDVQPNLGRLSIFCFIVFILEMHPTQVQQLQMFGVLAIGRYNSKDLSSIQGIPGPWKAQGSTLGIREGLAWMNLSLEEG